AFLNIANAATVTPRARTRDPMKILYLAHRVPYPPDRGDKIRAFHEIRHLARAHEVHVLCLTDGPEDLANVGGIEGHAASVAAVTRTDLGSNARSFGSLLAGRSFSQGYFDVADLHREIARAYRTVAPDVALAFSSGMAQFVEPFDGVPRVMDFVDLDSLKWKQ